MDTTLGMESSNFIEVSPLVHNYDFDGHNISMSDIANRIVSDMRFEEKCRKLAQDRYRKAKVNK